MKPTIFFIFLAAGAGTVMAQDLRPADGSRFQRLNPEREKPNEVTVVLDDVGKPPAPVEPKTPAQAPAATPKPEAPQQKEEEEEPADPVLVTGKPPVDAELIPSEPLSPPPPPEETKEKGVSVRVADIQSGNVPINPAKVKISSLFPSRAVSPAPAGWVFKTIPGAPVFSKEVELAPGAKIHIDIPPHVMVPEDDGAEIFTIQEPGYDPALGYRQTGTVGTMLASSIAHLDDDSRRIGEAIGRLEQLLVSLPPTPPEPAPPAAIPAKEPTPPKKR